MPKAAENIIEKAIIRCKKAQNLTKAYNDKKKIKAGLAAEKKLTILLQEVRSNEEYGELGGELELLDNMVQNMRRAVMEPLLESLETIERRMKAYRKAIEENIDSASDLGGLSASVANLNFVMNEKEDNEDMNGTNHSSPKRSSKHWEMPIEESVLEEFENTEITLIETNSLKQSKFFDKLSHFFEVQEIAEERNSVIDPHGKIASMKVKSHTKGIVEKDGVTYKKAYQQQDTQGKCVQTLGDLYEAAIQAEPVFKQFIAQLVDGVNGLTDQDLVLTTLKRRARASAKAQEEYAFRAPGPGESWLFDIVRAGVVCKSYKQMSDVNRWMKENVHIVDCENRFAMPQFDGYRDIIYHVSIPYKDELAHTCEIQVHHRDFKIHFGINSHMPFFRPYFAGAWRDQQDILIDLDMLLKIGRVDETFMEFLMDTTSSDQLKLFGRLFFENLDEFDKALNLFKRVLVMEEAAVGKEHIKTASTYKYIGLVLAAQADTDGALLYLREGLEVMQTTLGAEHPEVATLHSYIGNVFRQQGHFIDSLNEHRTALTIREKTLGEDHMQVAEAYVNVAHALSDQGDYKHAMAEYRTALIIQEAILGEKHEDVAPTHAYIGTVLMNQGEYDKARQSFIIGLSIRENTLGKTHPSVADAISDLANVDYEEGLYQEAEIMYRKALSVRENILGPNHPDCALSHCQIGLTMCQSNKFAKGIDSVRNGLKLMISALGKNNERSCNAFNDLGMAYKIADNSGAAAQCFKHVLSLRRSLFGKNHPATAKSINSIANIKAELGDVDAALAEYETSLNILGRVVGENHPLMADTYEFIAEAYWMKSNKTKALENYSKSLSIRNAVLGKYHPKTAAACNVIASLLREKGDTAGAKMAYRQALASYEHLHGQENEETATAHVNLGHIFDDDHEFEEAKSEFAQAVKIREKLLGPADILTAEAHFLLGSVLNRMGEFENALKEHKVALSAREKLLAPRHPDIAASKAGIEAASSKKYEDEIVL